MLKHLLLLVLVVASAGAHADVFKCQKPTGEIEFSDTPCRAGSSSEIVPDRDPVSQQQQEDAQRRLQEQKNEANDLAAQRAAAQADQQRQNNEAAAQAAPAPADASNEETVYGCYDGRRRDSNCASTPGGRGQYRRGNPGRGPIPR